MDDSVSVGCPHCGETFTLAVDASEGDAEYVVDCEVCCRPMTIRLGWEDGELVRLDVAPE